MAGSLDNPRTGTYISLVSSNPRPGETRQDHGGDHLLTLLPGAGATAPPVCTCPAAASAHPAAACLPYALLLAASPRAGRGLEGGGNCSIFLDSSDARVAGRRTGAPTFRCRGASTPDSGFAPGLQEDRVGRRLARPKVGEPVTSTKCSPSSHRRAQKKDGQESMPMRGELAPREQTPGCAARKNTPVAGCDSGRMRVRGDSSPDGDRHPFSTSRPCGPRHRSCDQHLPAHPGHNHGHLPGGLRPGVVQPGFFPTKESVYDGRQAVPPVS